MLKASDGCCHACGAVFDLDTFRKADTPHVDHDRSHCPGRKSCGKCVRGLLCDNCNRAIGLLGDDPDRIRRVADWLEKAKADVRTRVADAPVQTELPIEVIPLRPRKVAGR